MSVGYLTVINSALITISRAALFFACYKYLLSTVFHDLQSLTSGNDVEAIREAVDADSDVELDPLPAPSTLREGLLSKRSKSLSVLKHSNIARMSFSVCFSESCTLFLLFMCQEIQVFNARSRYLNWRMSLFLLLIMILLVIPLSQNIILTYQSPLGSLSRSRSMPMRVMMALIPYSIYLFAFSLIPVPEGLTSSNIESISLARLIVFGTFTMGLLSGLGAARNIWEYTPVFSESNRRAPTEQEVAAAAEALKRIRNDIQTRRREERRLQTSSVRSFSVYYRGKMITLGYLEWLRVSLVARLTSIQREITGLLDLEYQMNRNLDSLKSIHAKSVYNRTARGRAVQWMGRIFALYCIIRTISCLLNIFNPFHSTGLNDDKRSSYTDLIALVLTHLINALPFIHLSTDNILAVSRQISLILVGAIILSSIRFILKAVSRFLRITSQNLGASLLMLILAQIMGTYLISTLVQLRTAFPPTTSSDGSDPSLLATLPAYEVFGAAFDYSYLLSALATGAYLWLDERINGATKLED